MNFISKESCNYILSKYNSAVLNIKAGDTVTFETYDCFSNQLKNDDDSVCDIDFDRVNPATGPLYIEEAKENQTLKVYIKSIDILDQAVVTTGNNVGVLGHLLEDRSHKILKIKDDKAIFNNIELKLNKMIGVIGVAPKDDDVNCGTPGSHGGNMDCKIIGEDATVYFPVYHDGALLSMGDVHAVMGDGEIGVSGAEIGAKVTVEVDVLDSVTIKNPIVETKKAYYTIASALTLDEAYKIAVEDMFDLLSKKCSLAKDELIMLMSLTGDIEVCQVVDPLKTVRFKIKKKLLSKLNIDKLI